MLQDGDFTEPREYAIWLEWCFYAATELDATSLYVMRRHGGLSRIYGEAPVALESARAYFATQLRHAEHALQDGRAFLVGGRLTTADMLLTTCVTWAVSYQLPANSGMPRLHGEDHLSPRLPRRLGGQCSEEHGLVGLSLLPFLSRYGQRPGHQCPAADAAGF